MGNCCGKTEEQAPSTSADIIESQVSVPKDKQGLIIGKGGQTINQLQRETGTHISVPGRADPSCIVHIRGPRQGVYRAEQRIGEIARVTVPQRHHPMSSATSTASTSATTTTAATSSYGSTSASTSVYSTSATSTSSSSSGSEAFRAQAAEHARLRDMYFQQSREAYENGDGAKAKELSNKGHEQTALMKKANEDARDAAFAANNAGRPENEIDLHGLHVDEAISIVEDRLKRIKKWGKLTIIHGAGHHSDKGKARIKPAVQKLCRDKGYRFEVENEGAIIVHSKS